MGRMMGNFSNQLFDEIIRFNNLTNVIKKSIFENKIYFI